MVSSAHAQSDDTCKATGQSELGNSFAGVRGLYFIPFARSDIIYFDDVDKLLQLCSQQADMVNLYLQDVTRAVATKGPSCKQQSDCGKWMQFRWKDLCTRLLL